MRKLIHQTIVIALALLAAQAVAWGAPSISWTDQAGPHSVTLWAIDNPDYGEPNGQDPARVWFGVLPMAFDSASAITLTGTGNFVDGPDVLDQVRLLENVTNNTYGAWSDFHLQSPDGSAEF